MGRKINGEFSTVFKNIQVSFGLLQFPEELLWPCQNPHRVLKIFIYSICLLKSKETNKYKIKILYQHHQLAVPQELLHTDILKGCRQLPCPLNLKQIVFIIGMNKNVFFIREFEPSVQNPTNNFKA